MNEKRKYRSISEAKFNLNQRLNWLKEYEETDYPGRIKTKEYFETLEEIKDLKKHIRTYKKGKTISV